MLDLNTSAKNTWCPGCGNFAILNAIKAVLGELNKEGRPIENVVLVSGIGCHAKIVDYINANSFYSIHGRTLPAASAIKLAKPELKVICFAGDGDVYGEGIEHLIFSAKRNMDVTLVVHNNRVYGLTTGQYTPTSPLGFRGRSTPFGTKELPLNPLELVLASGATFIARGYSHGIELLKNIFKQAITHKGFSVVDVLQVCVTYFDMYEYYNKKVYELKEAPGDNYDSALQKIREWDYNQDKPISLGVFYKKDMPVFGQDLAREKLESPDRKNKIKEILNASI
ncbi:MAG: thiamine pyrophosphate-dependent enzyme [Candidatus Omnitrophota bacterium]|nr:thiamine pyrophosphate-dependent enzyme [Candidatus Omnitrophota bacterium]